MFWDAYIADTTHLTTEEHGAYLLLLGAMWRRNGWVPDDDADTARIVGMTKAKWRKTKRRLASLLIFSDGHITQKNLRKIWKNTQEKIAINRANGAKGGRPVARDNKDIAQANGSVSLNPNETIPEPEPDRKKDTSDDVSKESAETEPEDDDGKPGETANGMDAGPGEDTPKPEPKAAKPKAEPKRRIAEDRQPDNAAITYAAKLGVDVRRTWPDFVDYHVRRDTMATERGFAAAWRTWCRKAVEFAEQDKRMAGPAKSGKPTDWLEAFAMAERQANGDIQHTREAGLWGDDEGDMDTTGQVVPFGGPGRV